MRGRLGKSVIAAEIARTATAKHSRVLFLVHRKELCKQIQGTFIANSVDFDYCDIVMVQTYSRRMAQYSEPDIIIVDETHTNMKAYKKIFETYPEALKIGFTATPCRLNQGGLGELYSSMVVGVTTQWLIANDFLAPYKYYSVQLADTDNLHVKQGDFDKNEVAELMQNKEIYGSTVIQWEKLAPGAKTIVYCSSVESSKETALEFQNKGYNAYHLDGTSPAVERAEIVEQFRNGSVNILCNVDLFSVGFDVPDCECVILLRPIQSLALFVQQSMRSLRYKPDKTAIVIDHVGNVFRHDLPDAERQWSLLPKAKQENEIKIKECPKCFAVYPPEKTACPYCGTETHIVKERKGKKLVEVDLVEVQRQQDIKDTHLTEFKAETWDQVVEYQKLKKYKFFWCIRYCSMNDIEIPKKYKSMKRKFLK